MASEIRVNKINNRAGLGTITIADTGVVVNGIVTCTEISGLNALNIAGVSTFASPLDINGDIDVDGHTNLDNLSVAGVSTFSGEICLDTHPTRIKSSAGDLEIGVGTTSSFFITGGPYSAERLETTVDCVILYSAGSKVARTHNGRFEVGNPAAAIGIGATLSITGGANFAGIVTASSFSGDGSDLTGLASDKIFENNTKVEAVDSGTGYITAEVDGTEALRIKENGYFGLGTNSPVQDLHIRRDNAALRIETPSGSTLQASTGGISANFGTISNSNLNFVISNSTKMKLNTDGHLIPGTDSQHDLGLTGTRWRNVYADTYYGDGANLTNLPAGAPVGGATTNTVFFENDKAVAVNYQVTSTKNAMSAGPIAINAGIAVTVPSGCSWTIV